MPTLPEIILVPVDGSECATKAAAYAGELAQKLGAPIRLLFAFPATALAMMGGALELPNPQELRYFSPEYFEKMRSTAAEAAFKPAREALAGSAVKVEEKLLAGETGQAILAHAEPISGAMIVIGRRGLSSFRELVMGSTTQRVLHHAKCPVLVIR